VSGNPLRFLLDDGSEVSQGAVARIRPYDNVLSPAEVAALDQLVGATIPTLSEWGLAAMCLLLALAGLVTANRAA